MSPRKLDRLNVEVAVQFVEDSFGSTFQREPAWSGPEGARFDGAESVHAVSLDRAMLWVKPNGLIEMTLPVRHEKDSDGRLILPLAAVVEVMTILPRAIQAGWHYRLFPGTLRPFRRLDWYFGLSPAITDSQGWHPWAALGFPHGQPPRATDMRPPLAHPEGFAERRLRSRRQKLDAIDLLQLALEDLLFRSGYREFGRPVADVLQPGCLNEKGK